MSTILGRDKQISELKELYDSYYFPVTSSHFLEFQHHVRPDEVPGHSLG